MMDEIPLIGLITTWIAVVANCPQCNSRVELHAPLTGLTTYNTCQQGHVYYMRLTQGRTIVIWKKE